MRKLSKQQFSDGTVMAGEKLDDLWNAVKERFDLLDISDVANKYAEDIAVFGYRGRVVEWEPEGVGTGHPKELPWLPGKLYRAGGLDDTQFKGNNFPGISPPNYGVWYNWGISWHTGESPQLVEALDFMLDCDIDSLSYRNIWTWGGNPVYGLAVGSYVEDVGFELLIDAPLNPDDPSSSNVVVYRVGIDVSAQIVPQLPAFGADMQPAFPGGTLTGIWIHASDLHIPIPAGSRVRLLMTLPDYSAAYSASGNPIIAGDVRWRTTVNAPWALQAYSGSITTLLPRDVKKD
jgi:hypothetical protein